MKMFFPRSYVPLLPLRLTCLTAVLLSLFLLLNSPPAIAGDVNTYLREGNASFAAGKYQSAYDNYFQAFLLVPDNPEINFLLGRAAFEKGDYEAAVMAFDRVLIVKPQAQRVKLEMARSFNAMKSYEAARQYLLEVLASNPPEQVRTNIQAMLDQIDQRQKHHHFHGMLALGYSYDDNARTDPNTDTIDIPNLFPVTFARPSDNIYSSTVSLNHTYTNDTLPFVWKSDVVNYIANYQTENDLDITYLRLTSGPAWQHGNSLFEARPHLGQVDLGHHRYLRLYGLEGSWSLQRSATSLLQLALTGESRKNFKDSGRNSTDLLLEFSYLGQFGNNTLRISTAAERENARNSVHSYGRGVYGLQISRQFPDTWRAGLNLSFSHADYDGIDPLWGQNRIDDITVVSLDVSRSLWTSASLKQSIIADLNYTHTESHSTLDLYTYDKNVGNLSVAYAF